MGRYDAWLVNPTTKLILDNSNMAELPEGSRELLEGAVEIVIRNSVNASDQLTRQIRKMEANGVTNKNNRPGVRTVISTLATASSEQFRGISNGDPQTSENPSDHWRAGK